METLLGILIERGQFTLEEIDLLERVFVLLMTLPIVSTMTGIFRHIIGLKSLSIYAPIILTFSFYELGFSESQSSSSFTHGILYGLVLYAIVFATSTISYEFLRRIRMHYIPKSTIVLMIVSLCILFALFVGTFILNTKGLIYLDIFSIIMIATLSDTFVSSMARKSLKVTLFVGLQTIITAIIAFFIISLDQTRTLVLNYAALLIGALILINLYTGKFMGLRITEYWRFRELLLEDSSKNARNNKPDTKK